MDHLKEMADNPDLISGIFNYCDRWCERCHMTSRCLLFLSDEFNKSATNSDDDKAEVWEAVSAVCETTRALLQQIAHEEGIDLSNANVDEQMTQMKKNRMYAENHKCTVLASEYSERVSNWFEHVNIDVQDDTIHDIELAVDIIHYYRFFISVKIRRALEGDLLTLSDSPDLQTSDSCGSAKIALIALDRSMAAWGEMYRCFPDTEELTLKILMLLERLVRKTENTFPGARDFIRPGFDEVF